MARYLVTGGAGFIGSHLVDSLIASGDKVMVLDDFSSGKREHLNAGAQLVEGSLLDRDLLVEIAAWELDGCFHLAARPIVQDSIKEWKSCTEVNLVGTVNLFEVLTQNPESTVPVVYASSCAVYGASGREGIGIRESDRIDPQSPYAVDKYGCELHARAGATTRGLKSLGARFFNVYGDRQDPRSPYSGVVSKFRENLSKQLPLTIFGDGEQTRDFIHVSDVVALLKRSLSAVSDRSPVLNFGTGTAVSVNELAEIMISVHGETVPINREEPRLGEVRHSRADVSNLTAALGSYEFSTLTHNLEGLFV